jgi:hypothetical protein
MSRSKKVADAPRHAITIDDPRTQFLVLEAIVFTIEAVSKLDRVHRPDSDLNELRELLDVVPDRTLAIAQSQAHRWIEWLNVGAK